MMRNDPKSGRGRYDDLVGTSASAALTQVGWRYIDYPVTVALMSSQGKPLAMGFAAPVRLKSRKITNNHERTSYDAINLAYAVHSEYEGKGFGLISACIAIAMANEAWQDKLHDSALNIQTPDFNTPSLALARKLGVQLCGDACFDVTGANKPSRSYLGYRGIWQEAVTLAYKLLEERAQKFTFVAREKQEYDPETEPAPGIRSSMFA